jgi:hypothetical protein
VHAVHESQDGRTTFVEMFFCHEAFVHRAGRESIRLTRQGLHITALSPDGKWAVASSSSDGGVRVWDAQTGEHVRDLPNQSGSRLCFSPDGQTLITNDIAGKVIWDVATWTPRFEVPDTKDGSAATAFTPDGRIAAIGLWGKGVILMDVRTGRRLARLDIPNQPILLVDLCFTRDGSRLVAAADYAGVFVWDVRAFREQLATLGLDWDQSSLPAVHPTDVPPVRIEIAPAPARWWYDLGVAQLRAGDPAGALHSLQKAIELEPHGDPSLFLYRAMAGWRSGQKEGAREDYRRAIDWWEKNSTTDPSLQRLRGEVEQILEIRPSK